MSFAAESLPGIRGVDFGIDAARPLEAVGRLLGWRWEEGLLLRGVAQGGGGHPILVGGEWGRIHQDRAGWLLHIVAHHIGLAVRILVHSCTLGWVN